MRIALVSLHYAEYAVRLALALAHKNQVLLVLRLDNAERELSSALSERLSRSPAIQVLRINHRPLKDVRILIDAYRLYARVKAFAPDLIHCQEYLADYAVLPVLALWRSCPSVLTIHDHVTHSGTDSQLVGRAWHYRRWLRNRADRHIVHGERIRAELTAAMPAWADKIDAIAHGILGSDSAPFPMCDADSCTLLFFGRIEAYKGLGDLLSACEILVARGVAFRLIIAGRGNDLNHHRDRITNTTWVELQEDFIPSEAVPALFQRAAVVVLPYTDATQSGVAALAFAFGRPVIATDTGALPEVVIHGRTGLLTPPRAPAQLADALAELLLDPSKLKRLANGAAAFACTELNWETLAERTLATYEAAIKSNKRMGIEA